MLGNWGCELPPNPDIDGRPRPVVPFAPKAPVLAPALVPVLGDVANMVARKGFGPPVICGRRPVPSIVFEKSLPAAPAPVGWAPNAPPIPVG